VMVTLQMSVAIGGTAHGNSMVNIGVANHGSTSVSFSGGCAGIRLKGATNLFVIPQPWGQSLPHTLTAGTSMTLLADFAALKHAIRQQVGDLDKVQVRAEVRDQLERVHVSEWRNFVLKGWGRDRMSKPLTKNVPCERCGMKAKLTVTPDDFGDSPESFTLTRECSGRCPNSYTKLTPAEMMELTKRDASGWMSEG
jgi:hypothetical protein